jgi:hypothetical protein
MDPLQVQQLLKPREREKVWHGGLKSLLQMTQFKQL